MIEKTFAMNDGRIVICTPNGHFVDPNSDESRTNHLEPGRHYSMVTILRRVKSGALDTVSQEICDDDDYARQLEAVQAEWQAEEDVRIAEAN